MVLLLFRKYSFVVKNFTIRQSTNWCSVLVQDVFWIIKYVSAKIEPLKWALPSLKELNGCSFDVNGPLTALMKFGCEGHSRWLNILSCSSSKKMSELMQKAGWMSLQVSFINKISQVMDPVINMVICFVFIASVMVPSANALTTKGIFQCSTDIVIYCCQLRKAIGSKFNVWLLLTLSPLLEET